MLPKCYTSSGWVPPTNNDTNRNDQTNGTMNNKSAQNKFKNTTKMNISFQSEFVGYQQQPRTFPKVWRRKKLDRKQWTLMLQTVEIGLKTKMNGRTKSAMNEAVARHQPHQWRPKYRLIDMKIDKYVAVFWQVTGTPTDYPDGKTNKHSQRQHNKHKI